jgi:hypothetical protein
MATKIKLRYDTKANWTTVNPVLEAGEVAVEKDSTLAHLKVGDGVINYNNLPYVGSEYALDPTVLDLKADKVSGLNLSDIYDELNERLNNLPLPPPPIDVTTKADKFEKPTGGTTQQGYLQTATVGFLNGGADIVDYINLFTQGSFITATDGTVWLVATYVADATNYETLILTRVFASSGSGSFTVYPIQDNTEIVFTFNYTSAPNIVPITVTQNLVNVDERLDELKTNVGTTLISSLLGGYAVNGDQTLNYNAFRLSYTARDVNTGTNLAQVVNIPLADGSAAGLMSKEAYAKLDSLQPTAAVGGVFTGKTYATIAAMNADAATLSAANVGDYCYVIDDANHSDHTTMYVVTLVSTTKTWSYALIINTDVTGTPATATNDTYTGSTLTASGVLGVVKGSNQSGKIFVESNGTMSLVGYDSVISRIATLESALVGAEALVAEIQAML